MVNFEILLHRLKEYAVEFIIIGGAAAVVHGSSRMTQDLDIVYLRTPDNIKRVVDALADWQPYLRGVPPGLPFSWSVQTLQRGLNFTLSTAIGPVDLFGEVAGGGNYEELLPHTIVIDVFGVTCRCLDLSALLRTKRAAGRPKDLSDIAELEAIQEEQTDESSDSQA